MDKLRLLEQAMPDLEATLRAAQKTPLRSSFGELHAISKERRQSAGGRLDLLLKNPEDDSMYEVEVMLRCYRRIAHWVGC